MIKKILISLLTLLLICGCSSKENDINFSYEVKTEKVDMSAYKGVTSSKHNFELTNFDELFKCIDEKSSGIFYYGYSECPCCQVCVSRINKAAMDLNVKVYYIDLFSTKYPVDDKTLDKLKDYCGSILNKDDEGNKIVQTPTVFTVINGELKDSLICAGNMEFESDFTEAQETKIINKYRNMFTPFSEKNKD